MGRVFERLAGDKLLVYGGKIKVLRSDLKESKEIIIITTMQTNMSKKKRKNALTLKDYRRHSMHLECH